MNTVEFLKAMWPEQGIYVIGTTHPNSRPGGKDWFKHWHFDNIEAAAAFVTSRRENPDEQVYYALHTFRELTERTSKGGRTYMDVERVQTNTAFTRLLYADLDVGKSEPNKPKKNDSKVAALQALVSFIGATRLPKPTVVDSGYGVHIYWRFTADLPSADWQRLADKLQRLFVARKLRVDPTITIDSARVLRPIHTWNRKVKDSPVKVALLRSMQPPLEWSAFEAELDRLLVGVPELPTRRRFEGGAGASGIVLAESHLQPPTIAKLGSVCATFRMMAAEAKTCSGEVWRATLELLRHTTGGEAACHKASKDHPTYDWQDTQDRLQRYEARNQGPTTCGRLQGIYGEASPCPSCPHYGSPDTSPIAIARREPEKPLPPTVPPCPPGFRRSSKGIEAEIKSKDADGEEDTFWTTIYDCDFYPLRIIDDPVNKRKVIEWHAMLPIKGDTVVTLPVSAYTDENKMTASLADQGVFVTKQNAKKVGVFVSLYIQQLQKFAAEQSQVSTAGWTEHQQRFILADGSHGPEGVIPVVFAPSMANVAASMGRKGTLEGQLAALRFYDNDEYVRQQVMVCMSAVAPLFYITGHYGVLVNLSGPSGASKSTALFMAASVWGIPEKFVLNGTAGGMSQNARMTRLATLANLPVVLDDITDMDPVALKQTAMGVTQPGSRIINNRDGTERTVPDSLKSSVMLMSSNPPLHSMLSQDNVAGDAGSMRTVDMPCLRLNIHTKREADDYLRRIKDNCGHVGPVVIDYVLSNRASVEAMLRATIIEIEELGHVQQQERFWSTAIAMAVFGARLLRQLGLVRYNSEHMLRWFVEEQLPAMRSTVHEAYTDPLGALQQFLADNVNNMLQVSHTNGGYVLMEKPQGRLVGRLEYGSKQLWISVAAFRSWCVYRKLPYEAYVRDLLSQQIVFRERMDLGRHITGIPAAGANSTLRINLNHEAISETVDSSGKIVDFPLKNERKPLVSAS